MQHMHNSSTNGSLGWLSILCNSCCSHELKVTYGKQIAAA
jgi:hypothetical protein